MSLGDQILYNVEKGLIEMGLDTMVSTNFLLTQDLIEDDIFHGVVYE